MHAYIQNEDILTTSTHIIILLYLLAVRASFAIRGSLRPAGARPRPSPGRLARGRARFAGGGPCSSVRCHLSSGKHGCLAVTLLFHAPEWLSSHRFAVGQPGGPPCCARPSRSWGPWPLPLGPPANRLRSLRSTFFMLGRGRRRPRAAPSPTQSPVRGRPHTPAAVLVPEQTAA